jgi:hypothetical protein
MAVKPVVAVAVINSKSKKHEKKINCRFPIGFYYWEPNQSTGQHHSRYYFGIQKKQIKN